MAAGSTLVKKITTYLDGLNTDQQKAVLAVVKSFAQEEQYFTDKKFLAEMDKRFAEMESGKVSSLTLDELEMTARKNYKSRKRKN